MKEQQLHIPANPIVSTASSLELHLANMTTVSEQPHGNVKSRWTVRFRDSSEKDATTITNFKNSYHPLASESFSWPATSYYRRSTFPSLLATFSGGWMKNDSNSIGTEHQEDLNKCRQFQRQSTTLPIHAIESNVTIDGEARRDKSLTSRIASATTSRKERFPWRQCGHIPIRFTPQTDMNNNITGQSAANEGRKHLKFVSVQPKTTERQKSEEATERQRSANQNQQKIHNDRAKNADKSVASTELKVEKSKKTNSDVSEKLKNNPVRLSSKNQRHRTLSHSSLFPRSRSQVFSKRIPHYSSGVISSPSSFETWKHDSSTGTERQGKNISIYRFKHSEKGNSTPNVTKLRSHSVKSMISNTYGNEDQLLLNKNDIKTPKVALVRFYSAHLVDSDLKNLDFHKQLNEKSRHREGRKRNQSHRSAEYKGDNSTEAPPAADTSESPQTSEVLITSDGTFKTQTNSNEITSEKTKNENISSLNSTEQLTNSLLNKNASASSAHAISLENNAERFEFSVNNLKSQSALPMRNTTTKSSAALFLSPDQLVIRDSIEKVQRWMRGLPKHFDPIHHILPPVQHDY